MLFQPHFCVRFSVHRLTLWWRWLLAKRLSGDFLLSEDRLDFLPGIWEYAHISIFEHVEKSRQRLVWNLSMPHNIKRFSLTCVWSSSSFRLRRRVVISYLPGSWVEEDRDDSDGNYYDEWYHHHFYIKTNNDYCFHHYQYRSPSGDDDEVVLVFVDKPHVRSDGLLSEERWDKIGNIWKSFYFIQS